MYTNHRPTFIFDSLPMLPFLLPKVQKLMKWFKAIDSDAVPGAIVVGAGNVEVVDSPGLLAIVTLRQSWPGPGNVYGHQAERRSSAFHVAAGRPDNGPQVTLAVAQNNGKVSFFQLTTCTRRVLTVFFLLFD